MSTLNENIPTGFLQCAHCHESGTCSSGNDGISCEVCTKQAKAKKPSVGLVCSVCNGLGSAEPKTFRLQNRLVPVLAIFLAYVAFILILFSLGSQHFSEILAFCGTLIGSITGYYFGGKSGRT